MQKLKDSFKLSVVVVRSGFQQFMANMKTRIAENKSGGICMFWYCEATVQLVAPLQNA